MQSDQIERQITDPDEGAARLARMTLDEKIGQLLMVGYSGLQPPGELLEFLQAGLAGGVILFADNVTEPDQVAELTGKLQEAARSAPLGLPLFIAIDHEGGAVIRLGRGVTVFPGNMALGAVGSEAYAYLTGKAMAEELEALGINMNLAPVLDVNNNPDNPIIGIRSFGEDPEAVACLGAAMIKGLRDGGVLAVGKHFPGHGDTTVDSHLNLPTIPHPVSRLEKVELKPFQKAIANAVDCIMTAHVVFPALEPVWGLPATLSETVLTELLRKKLGFTGLIMTDCLEMDAIAANYEVGVAAARAVLAGADQVLISHSFAKQRVAHCTIRNWVEQGLIPVSRIDEAVSRILTYKMALLKRDPAVLKEGMVGLQQAGWAAHEKLARQIAADALTLLRNRRRLLPLQLNPTDEIVVICFQKKLTVVEENHDGLAVSLAGTFREYHSRIFQLTVAADLDAAARSRLQAELGAKPPALVIAATQDAAGNPEQAALVRQLADRGYPLVVIAMRTPYDLQAFPEVDTYVAAYGFRRVTLEALAQLLWGKITPKGKLPVAIPGLYPIGSGLEHF